MKTSTLLMALTLIMFAAKIAGPGAAIPWWAVFLPIYGPVLLVVGVLCVLVCLSYLLEAKK